MTDALTNNTLATRQDFAPGHRDAEKITPIPPFFFAAAASILAGGLFPAICDAVTLPTLQIGLEEAKSPQQVAVLIEILLLFTVLSMAPAILLMMTCFTRLIVTFSFLKHAMGTQQMPPNQVMVGLALFLTLFIMMPVFRQMNTTAIQPYMNEEINAEDALKASILPLRTFMFSQTREKDLALFLSLAKEAKPQNKDDISTVVLIPAFMISELKTAFQIGFVLFLPFLIIDMVVSSVLLSMGMMMLPPIMVSLPFKLLLFVLVDGWYLVVGSLVKSFGV
ncbi:MAG: flagellar type III secretion system pore protein FliP [Proteobacteria bacterium]|nr:flagellar type III secretion system pore protein FliP [Pseudomonadota bacterium]MBU1708878.1 flagellar type III secretion system pore protein FliP [Pseudomonadota bacterium]